MNLLQLSENVAKLMAAATAQGLDPKKLECVTSHSSSGASAELCSAHIAECTGKEWSGPQLDMKRGDKYVDFTIQG